MKKINLIFSFILLNILIVFSFINSVSAETDNREERIITELMAQIVQMENILKSYNLSLENQETDTTSTKAKENQMKLEDKSDSEIVKIEDDTLLESSDPETEVEITTPVPVSTYNCLKIKRVMRPEDYRDDIINLQEFLEKRGHFSHPHITKYFGPVTKKSVQDFQTAEGIINHGTPQTTGFGQVGPLTIKKIEEITCSTE